MILIIVLDTKYFKKKHIHFLKVIELASKKISWQGTLPNQTHQTRTYGGTNTIRIFRYNLVLAKDNLLHYCSSSITFNMAKDTEKYIKTIHNPEFKN